jgi:hypothetical protein
MVQSSRRDSPFNGIEWLMTKPPGALSNLPPHGIKLTGFDRFASASEAFGTPAAWPRQTIGAGHIQTDPVSMTVHFADGAGP